MKTEQEPLDVLVFVEKDEADRLKIRSDQLEQIGHKLRGFSVFNSVILPLMVSVATVFFTGLFQYISWTNEVRLREATEIANRAMNVSEKVTTAINKRVHLTFLFLDPLRSLVLATFRRKNSEPSLLASVACRVRIPTIATTRSDASRPPVPNDRDQHGAGYESAVRCIC
ncbi:MAG: hypothetical protein WAU53_06070 [Rhodoplanes sp.]